MTRSYHKAITLKSINSNIESSHDPTAVYQCKCVTSDAQRVAALRLSQYDIELSSFGQLSVQ